MTTTIYKATELTGGGAEALDAIDGAGLQDGDFALGMFSGILRIYELDETSGLPEDSPAVIAPDANPGNKRWIEQVISSDLLDHLHDDRYYTEAEIGGLLAGKSDLSHNHDSRYYTESEVNILLSAKSANTHNHDDDYTIRQKGSTTIINGGRTPKAYLSTNNSSEEWKNIVISIPSGLTIEPGGIQALTVLDDLGAAASNVSYTVNADVIAITAQASSAARKLYIEYLTVYGV